MDRRSNFCKKYARSQKAIASAIWAKVSNFKSKESIMKVKEVTKGKHKYKDGDYAKSTTKIPLAKAGRTKHPLHGKLVGG